LLDQRDLAIGEQSLADESTDGRFNLPRRHEAAARDLGDLGDPAADFVVGRQWEWTWSACTMARHAGVEDDWGDVLRKGLRFRTGSQKGEGNGKK
jgi:hypothetical protein